MARDYYKLLEIPREADYSTICEAFRTLALRWHPQRHEDNQFIAFKRFNDVCEAFEVLSNSTLHLADRKTAYDQLGEYGLKNGVPDGHGGHTGGYSYSGSAFQIFTDFFGNASPFANSVDRTVYADVMEGYVQATYGEELSRNPVPLEKEPEPLVVLVPCTLEELYNGCKKVISFTRRVINRLTHQLEEQTKAMEVEVRKGHYEDEVRAGQGHEALQHPSGDLVLRIQELHHDRFVRKDQDLVLTVCVSLLTALLAAPLEFVPFTQTTLDNRILTLSFDHVISPKTRKIIPNEGMPLPLEFDFSDRISKVYGIDKQSPARGQLIIKFDVQFPKYIPEADKAELRLALQSN